MPGDPDALLSLKICEKNSKNSYNPNNPLKEEVLEYVDREFDSGENYEVAIIGTGENPNYAKEIAHKINKMGKDNIDLKAIDPELVPKERYDFQAVPETYQEHYGLDGESAKAKDLAKHVCEDLEPEVFGVQVCSHQNEDSIKEIESMLSENGYEIEKRRGFPPRSLVAYDN